MSSQLPATLDLCRVRGDTFPVNFTLTDSAGAAVDITAATFLLTVDPSAAPSDALANIFQIVGTITDAPNGKFQFAISPANADQTPDDYNYDVQMTDSGGSIRTISKGKWQVVQDITK